MTERVSPTEAKHLIDEEGYVYVDVRSVPEFEQGHPKGAYNLPIAHMGVAGMVANPDFVAQVERAFPDKGAKLVVGCQAGGRSLKAAGLLEEAGYTSVVDQRAGWGGAKNNFGQLIEKGWKDAGLPTSKSAESGRSYADLSG